jgi:hypothetical protein
VSELSKLGLCHPGLFSSLYYEHDALQPVGFGGGHIGALGDDFQEVLREPHCFTWEDDSAFAQLERAHKKLPSHRKLKGDWKFGICDANWTAAEKCRFTR